MLQYQPESNLIPVHIQITINETEINLEEGGKSIDVVLKVGLPSEQICALYGLVDCRVFIESR